MIRVRRYRAFIAIAVFCIVGLYYLNGGGTWADSSDAPALQRLRTEKLSVEPALPPKDDESASTDVKRPASEPEHFADTPGVEGQDTKAADAFPQIEIPGAPTSSVTTTSSSSSSLLDIFPHPGKPTSFQRDPPDPFANVGKPTTSSLADPRDSTTSISVSATSSTPTITSAKAHGVVIDEDGQGRLELPTETSSSSAVHFSKQSERYPVPTASIIPIPTNTKSIPTVQYKFEPENVIDRKARESKRAAVKEAFLRHWKGYKLFAWEHDELRPVSGKFTDPFAGWRATLVDSLDVLWIMGLKEEFEEAVEAVKDIDFTTTRRDRLPMFEVAIRYLGGLVAAYDVSGKQYSTLLDKAKELAEVLFVAFDTPNRMPQTHFRWRPKDVAKPHVGTRAAVLAEVGSLCMEFTRLAQLTKEPKYYDAIARITNELEGYQNNTKLPGLWPMSLDLSGGCIEGGTPATNRTSSTKGTKHVSSSSQEDKGVKGAPPRKPAQKDLVYDHSNPSDGTLGKDADPRKDKDDSTYGTDRKDVKPAEVPDPEDEYHKKDESSFGEDNSSISKRQLDDDADQLAQEDMVDMITCKPEPIGSSNSNDKFTMGSNADSAYEYLPKEYLLLGGQNEQYKTMYEGMMKTMKEYLLYRPMIGDETRRILFTGSWMTRGKFNMTTGRYDGRLDPETGHLSCFEGAFIGLAAKIWDRPEDLELAEQLADSCVWAYEQQVTGIMPETMVPLPCEELTDEPCKWNKTAWWHAIDPYAEQKAANEVEALKHLQAMVSASPAAAPTLAATSSSASATASFYQHSKRQLNNADSADDTKEYLKSSAEEHGSPNMVADRAGQNAKDNTVKKTSSGKENVVADNDALDKLLGPHVADGDPAAEKPTRTSPGLHLGPQDSDARTAKLNTNGYLDSTNQKPKSLEEAMTERIKNEALTPGIVRSIDRRYILRPEAIESVFYMYRITGSESWRTKGWAMFQAIEKYTKADYGSSAIQDVSSTEDTKSDAAESFWTAETLKYFYLLFSEPDLLSLDYWALNTEAHPFRRPDAGFLDPEHP